MNDYQYLFIYFTHSSVSHTMQHPESCASVKYAKFLFLVKDFTRVLMSSIKPCAMIKFQFIHAVRGKTGGEQMF